MLHAICAQEEPRLKADNVLHGILTLTTELPDTRIGFTKVRVAPASQADFEHFISWCLSLDSGAHLWHVPMLCLFCFFVEVRRLTGSCSSTDEYETVLIYSPGFSNMS